MKYLKSLFVLISLTASTFSLACLNGESKILSTDSYIYEDREGNIILEQYKGKDYQIIFDKGFYLIKHRKNSLNFIQMPNTNGFETKESAYKALIRIIT